MIDDSSYPVSNFKGLYGFKYVAIPLVLVFLKIFARVFHIFDCKRCIKDGKFSN